ncbi:MAG: hypothetical protein U7127_14390 [Phormidium sp.]
MKAPFLLKTSASFSDLLALSSLPISAEIVGTQHERDNVGIANIDDAVSLPPPTDFFSKTRHERDNVGIANINDAVSLPPPTDFFSKL